MKNLRENSYSMNVFDAIFVCNGHYNVPFYPNIEGKGLFKGRSMHSHDYRRPEEFKGDISTTLLHIFEMNSVH